MVSTHCHVIVIGAGIGGLTAALSLQRHGFKVSVYEQASELREFGAGLLVTPNAMHALEFLGVGEVIAATSNVSNEQLIRANRPLLQGIPVTQSPLEKRLRLDPSAHWRCITSPLGRVSTLGDAAHPTSPFLGQGAVMAIEDGMVLGRCFAQTTSPYNALLRYERARKHRANTVQIQSRERRERVAKLQSSASRAGRSADDLGLFGYDPTTVPI
jgi:2-polyprenyl-6-methoxyphenol hydroxylase-like FAD-dependent oxidoreductase